MKIEPEIVSKNRFYLLYKFIPIDGDIKIKLIKRHNMELNSATYP